MANKSTKPERNGVAKPGNLDSIWVRAFTAHSEWPDKVSCFTKILII